MYVEVRQGLVIGVQVEHHIGRCGQLHQLFLPLLNAGRRSLHGRRLVERAIEVMSGSVVITAEDPPLAKLPDTQRVGLRHDGDVAFEPALGFGGLQSLHQQVQDQHPGDFIGMYTGLQVHVRPAAVACITPGTDPHGVTVVVANTERNILRHWLSLPS
ncbi:hypothetical protein D3C81_1610000 [compost metagenome]